jgi:hypothetical protein
MYQRRRFVLDAEQTPASFAELSRQIAGCFERQGVACSYA